MVTEIELRILASIDSVDEAQYGANYKDHLLEQYKVYLGMADKISDRRASTNTFFLTLNTAIVSAIGVAGYYSKEKTGLNKDYVLFLTLGLLLFCYVWYRLIRSYKDLNSAKFRVVHAIEKRLPVKPFDAEWEGLARGKDSKVYLPFSKIEIYVPLIWGIIYLLIAVYLVWQK